MPWDSSYEFRRGPYEFQKNRRRIACHATEKHEKVKSTGHCIHYQNSYSSQRACLTTEALLQCNVEQITFGVLFQFLPCRCFQLWLVTVLLGPGVTVLQCYHFLLVPFLGVRCWMMPKRNGRTLEHRRDPKTCARHRPLLVCRTVRSWACARSFQRDPRFHNSVCGVWGWDVQA